MTFLKLPLLLAGATALRGVGAICIEDNCYNAAYQNPAGVEECSDHFITTVIPAPTTRTVTITSGEGYDITTISGPLVGISTVIPSWPIPTFIVRACYGDVEYRFQSACFCIGAGPTTTLAPTPTVTDTVVIPSITKSRTPSHTRPLITATPFPGGSGNVTDAVVVGPGFEPACLAVGQGPVVVTIQVDEFVIMPFTVVGPLFCVGEPTLPLPQSSQSSQPSECNCPIFTLPSSESVSSTTGLLPSPEQTSPSATDNFSSVFLTSSSEGFSESSTALEEPTSTSAEPSSTPTPEASESTTSSHTFLPFETRNLSSTVEPSSTTEPTSTEAPSSSTEPSNTAPSPSSTAPAGPTPFVPVGPEMLIKVTAGDLAGQYLKTDDPGEVSLTNIRSHLTPDVDSATVWTLDRDTAVLYQRDTAGGTGWWAAYYTVDPRKNWSSVLLLPAETVVGWLTMPVFQREALRCDIDFTDFTLTCGTLRGLTRVVMSDKCGWTLSTPLNPLLDRASGCPGSVEMLLQAVVIYPEEQGISR